MEKMSEGLKWLVYGSDAGLDASLQKNCTRSTLNRAIIEVP